MPTEVPEVSVTVMVKSWEEGQESWVTRMDRGCQGGVVKVVAVQGSICLFICSFLRVFVLCFFGFDEVEEVTSEKVAEK